MQPDLGSRFASFTLDSVEEEKAKTPGPYFFALLQNKISAYAHAVIEHTYTGDITQSLIVHERLKAQVEVLEELMRELTPPVEQPADDSAQS